MGSCAWHVLLNTFGTYPVNAETGAEVPWPARMASKAPSTSSLRCAPPKSISDLLQGWPGWGSAKCKNAFSCTSEWQLSARNYQLPVLPTGLIAQMRWCWNYWLFCTDGQTKKTLQVLECPRSGIVFWETCGSLFLRDTTKQKMRKSCIGDGGESRATYGL